MSLRSLITGFTTKLKKEVNPLTYGGFVNQKIVKPLATYQQSKIGQAHMKAGKNVSDILFKNPYEFGQQMTKDISDLANMKKVNYQMRNAPNTAWKNVGKQAQRALSTGSFIAGAGNPKVLTGMTALSGGINYGSNRLLGKQDQKTALTNTAAQAVESLPKYFQMAGISKFTNPAIDKIGAGKSFLARNALKAGPNVVEGLIMDQATGLPTTKESVAIDALFPVVSELAGKTFKSAREARIKTKYALDESFGTGARTKGKYTSLEKLLKDKKGKGKTNFMAGAAYGIEPYQDENGNWKVRFNQEKALIGLGLAYGGTKILGGTPNLGKSDLDDILKAQELKSKGYIQGELQAKQGIKKPVLKSISSDALKQNPQVASLKSVQEQVLNQPILRKELSDSYKDIIPQDLGIKGDITKVEKSIPELKQTEVLPKTKNSLPSPEAQQKLQQLSQKPQMQYKDTSQSFEDIITQNKKMIGSTVEKPSKTAGETFRNLYTQWVDRYEPITRASNVAKTELKAKGAELRPEYDPEYLVRRLTGAGGIADARYQNELKPIIDTMDNLKIDKGDMDLYLANKRIAGFETAGRKVYGADTTKAKQIVGAIETKYGSNVKDIADKLYKYQDSGFQEMVNAGFISPETAKIIKGQNPDYAPLQRVMDEVDNYLGLPTRKTMQGTQPISKLKGSTKQIDSPLENIIGNTFKQRAAIEKNRVASSIVGLQKVSPQLGFSKVAKSGDDTITVWNNGKKEFWKVGEDIATTAKGLNEENTNTILKIFKAPASLLRQGATGRNPEFMIPNIVRDQLDAGITSKYGYIPFVDYLSGLKSLLTKDDIYRKWENSGAKIDLGEMSGRKSIKESFDSKTAKKSLFSWVGKGLDTVGKYSEQPTRIGLFKKAYKKTGNEMLSMMESRDATVDFARMGSKMKTANSIIPFLNVQVQGFDKLIRAAKDNPAKVALLGTVYGVLPSVMTTLYNIVNHGEEYSEIPQYEKDSNFVIVKGRNENGTVDYITIPKGNIIPTIANPVENFLSYLSGTSQLEFKEYATQLLTSTLPIVGDGGSLGEVALKTVGSNLPQLVKPITENLVNKSFYKYDPKKEEAKEIVPYYLKDKEPYKQDYKFTPQMYKGIGAVLNVSPLKVKNLMEGYLAGYAKIPAQVIEMMYKASNKEEISPNEKTILRRFLKQTYPSSTKTSNVSKKTTPFMQRVTGKVSASTEEQLKMELDEARDEVRNTGKIVTTKDSIVYPYNDSTRVVKKTISVPKLTSSNELNKKILSDYKSDLTDYTNYIMYQYENGLISEQKAEEALVNVNNIKKWITNRTKTSSGSSKKVKLPNISAIAQKTLKPVKVEVSKRTPLNTFDILSDYNKLKSKSIDFTPPNLKKGSTK